VSETADDWVDEDDEIASTLVIPGLHDRSVAIFLNWESGRLSGYTVETVEEAIAELRRLNITRNIQWASPEPEQ
jgi:hypothetical protein